MMIRFFLALMMIGMWSGPLYAAPDMSDFRALPVLDEGRIKPLDSFARLTFKRLSGQSDHRAIYWLAETIFNPAQAVQLPVFAISRDDLKSRLGLPPDKNLYNYLEIIDGIADTRDEAIQLGLQDIDILTPDQLALLDLHERAILYDQLLRSLSLILPLKIDETESSFLEFQRSTNPAASTPDDTAQALDLILSGGARNALFRIIPDEWDTSGQNWLSPWQVILQGSGGPKAKNYLALWEEMALSYRNGENSSFAHASAQARQSLSMPKLKIEMLYNQFKPFFWAKIWYGLTLIFGVLWIWRQQPRYWRPAVFSLSIASFLHLAGIALRVYILQRPPVATLYESVLFVAVICGLTGLVLALKRRQTLPLMLGAISALALLSLSLIFIQDGDSKGVLMAVLNTHFWLATHVLVISIGYAACLMAGLYAHYLLWQGVPKYSAALLISLIAALFFTALGTALGGIWADQSWGRFWGWDPKENGALLIVLWLVWVIHGKLSGDVKPAAFNALAACLPVITALSWFGTNLLGVGLHSYGFTTGLTTGLFAFCGIESAIILALYLRAKRTNKHV